MNNIFTKLRRIEDDLPTHYETPKGKAIDFSNIKKIKIRWPDKTEELCELSRQIEWMRGKNIPSFVYGFCTEIHKVIAWIPITEVEVELKE